MTAEICKEANDAFGNGLALGLFIIGPSMFGVWAWATRHFTTEKRLQRRYERELNRRAEHYVSYGFSYDAARSHAVSEMNTEALAALKA